MYYSVTTCCLFNTKLIFCWGSAHLDDDDVDAKGIKEEYRAFISTQLYRLIPDEPYFEIVASI